jgi:membrane protein
MKIVAALFNLLRAAIDKWNTDRAPRLAAALAYYATFSLAPLVLVTIWMAGLLFGNATAQNYLLDQVRQVFGPDSATFVQSMIAARQSPSSALIGLIT